VLGPPVGCVDPTIAVKGPRTEEISHVELIGTTIARLLDGSPAYQGKKTDPVDEPGAKGATPLKIATTR
jgi:Mn-containing catalase